MPFNMPLIIIMIPFSLCPPISTPLKHSGVVRKACLYRNLPPPITDPPAELERSKSFDSGCLSAPGPSKRLETLRFAPTPPRPRSNHGTPPGSSCGHADAGQELCYLCHQRERRNIPVSFTEERKRREAEEDRLLQQFQYMKDTEDLLKEQV